MYDEILLPYSKYIDINLGLKYLNGNKKLYLKILNSFSIRYKDFDINILDENEFKNEMHTLKGLCGTLGMESLSNLAKNLQNEQKKELLLEFSKTLTFIIKDLEVKQTKTLLIIDNISDDLDHLIDMLEDSYDIMVTTTPNDDLDSLCTENIDLVLLSTTLSTPKIKHKLKQKNIPSIDLHKPMNLTNLLLAITKS